MSVLLSGFSAYGHVVTSVAGHSVAPHEMINVTRIHQITLLPVCETCGAAVPIPYQQKHLDWHEKLRKVFDTLEDRADALDDSANPSYLSRGL